MKKYWSLIVSGILLVFSISLFWVNKPTPEQSLPDGFVLLSDVVPDIVQEIRYYSTYNFVGARVNGYNAPVAILTKEAADALKYANDEFNSLGYRIKIYDAYRPQSAVNHFVSWAEDIDDVKMKDVFYPDLDKKDLFSLGYIARQSSHSRGSTVDMTLIDMKTGQEIDTGSAFDSFDKISNHGTDKITKRQTENRELIMNVMGKHGFAPYEQEWWHYTLENEPHPNTYYDFPVELYNS